MVSRRSSRKRNGKGGASMETKTASENLKIVPQIFFDLIARVVPGALAMVACLLLSGSNWSCLFNHVIGGPSEVKSFPAVSFLAFWVASYVVGQMLSPFVKCLQRLSESDWVNDLISKSALVQRYCDIESPMPRACRKDYDFLRCHHPAIGEMCQKIRAEFLMHYGIAIVLFASAACSLVPFLSQAIGHWSARWILFGALVLGGIFAAIRGRATRDTHEKTITKFMDVLNKS